MIYTEFKGKKLSTLGFGAMRMPTKSENRGDIDEENAGKLIELCFEKGINYFDTGYGYHDGQSEIFLGKVLKKYPRNEYYIADKFPGYDLLMFPKFDEIFEEQLKKCQAEYFDFYLMHNLCELNYESYINPKFRIKEKLLNLKARGKIKHIGLSSHAEPETLERFLDELGDITEFCQIQLNAMDWELQRAKDAVRILNKRNIPIWVMEPLRGGEVLSRMSARQAFDFVRYTDGVSVVLSGMSDTDQIESNTDIFSQEPKLSIQERNEIIESEKSRLKDIGIPCTGCGYCLSYCQKNLNIPFLLKNVNEYYLTKDDFIAPMAIAALDEDKHPRSCISCGECKKVCPQGIDIPYELAKFTKELEDMDEIND